MIMFAITSIIFADFLIDSSDKSENMPFFFELLLPYLMVNSLSNYIVIMPSLLYTVINLFSPPPLTFMVRQLLRIRVLRMFILNVIFALTLGVQIFAFRLFFTSWGPQFRVYKDNMIFFDQNDLLFDTFWFVNLAVQIFQISEIVREYHQLKILVKLRTLENKFNAKKRRI